MKFRVLKTVFTAVALAGFLAEAALAQPAKKASSRKGVVALASYPARHPKESGKFLFQLVKKAIW